MSDYRKHIEEAIAAVVLHSPTSYSWFGKCLPRLSPNIKRLLTPKTARNYLLFNLQLQLYSDFYCRGFAASSSQAAIGLPAVGRTPFVEELSAANCGIGYQAHGWKVRAIRRGEVIVQGEGLELCVRSSDCLIPDGSAIAVGLKLSLPYPKELLAISPGFYMACGNKELGAEESESIVRFYWNLTPEGAIRFIKHATLRLNESQLPFNLKALNDQRGYSRCDAVVLYIRRSDYHDVAKILEEIYPSVSLHLKPGTPVFTKLLAPGVGLAEDPGEEFSFGEHRCRLLADGIIRADEQDKKSLREIFQVVAERFAEDGVDRGRPFLNPGSSDDYHFQPRSRVPSEEPRGLSRHTNFDSEIALHVAEAIANRLSQDAVWDGDRCSWLGVEPMDLSITNRRLGLVYRALGPDLYDGTSGIALFFAQLHTVTGDVAARRTAIGAVTHALSRVHALPASARLGLFTGAIGVAYAAALVGKALEEETLLEQAANLLRDYASEEHQEAGFDLLTGAAGAIVALVVLREILNDESLISFAKELAAKLLRVADKSGAGYSWASPGSTKQRNLTGFSHGAAGVAYALLELFHATGETEYRVAAERAFDYERGWFDADAGNWPDFREEGGQVRRRNAPSFAALWCHGAPGIALSRLRAWQILKDDTCKADAVLALQTTRQTIRQWLDSGNENYSLCHGLSGNAEVLIFGCQVLGESTDDRVLVSEVAKAGHEKYTNSGGAWPCGVGGEETPGLMLGLAGIGHFYLRLYAPQIPCVLLPHTLAPDV